MAACHWHVDWAAAETPSAASPSPRRRLRCLARQGGAADPDEHATVSRELLAQREDAETGREHWKIPFVSRMGFFTDAHDLFIIGVVATMITAEWHISSSQKSLLSSLALLSSAVGAVVSGRIADHLGRQKIYGYECWCSPRVRSRRPSRPASGGSLPCAACSASGSAVTTPPVAGGSGAGRPQRPAKQRGVRSLQGMACSSWAAICSGRSSRP